jgi:bile acid:Na+ symporter, BASS family
VFAFVVLSMLSAGLTLSPPNVRAQFKSARLVVAALAANFVLVPLTAWLIAKIVPFDQSLSIALLLLGTASGAPMLPKLVEFGRGNLALAVGLMALLMAGTILTMPLVLPLILPGVHVNPWSIAKPLLLIVLPSLAVGLGLRTYSRSIAERLQPFFRSTSNLTLGLVIVLAVATNFSNAASARTLSTVLAGASFIVITFGIGFALGGPDADSRRVLALGTTQRSVSVAFLVAVQNFRGTNVVDILAILAVLALVLQVPAALALGVYVRRHPKMVR